jgi:hypothetical protein
MFNNLVTKTKNIFSHSEQAFSGELLKKYKKIMNEKVSPIIQLLPEDIACAQAARQSYEIIGTRKLQIEGYLLDEKHSTAGACIYYDPDKKICIL